MLQHGGLVQETTWKGVYLFEAYCPILDSRREWQSGLTEACLKSPHVHDAVRRAVLEYIKKWIPQQRVGVLAGNSVHADRVFLVQEMPEVVDWLHYRCVLHNLPFPTG